MDTHRDPDSELRSLEERFRHRQFADAVPYPRISDFQLYSRFEKEYWQGRLLLKRFKRFGELSPVTLLEVGAGSGANVFGLLQLGIERENLYGNELVPSLADQLERRIAPEKIFRGDIRTLDEANKFDVVFQSTVMSSILNRDLAQEVAQKMWRLTKPLGMILWYDLRVNNPGNPDVRGIGVQEIRELFPRASGFEYKRVTLAPPIGRRVGRLYNFLNFPFLRSHILAAVYKDEG